MNKYIRTKDKIVDLIKICRGDSISHYEKDEAAPGCCAGWYSHIEEYDGTQLELRDDEIVAQANTIEELCDAAVVEWPEDDIPSFHEYINKDLLLNLLKTIDGLNVYGVIHLKGKGLIYVAKMNEKGEFELL